jgi:hypothetical protein
MKERPILFSGSMVRAILKGRKTQTRRIVKPQPERLGVGWKWRKNANNAVSGGDETGNALKGWMPSMSPYGKPGDRLWVRETFLVQPFLWTDSHGPQPVHYAATTNRAEAEDYTAKPSIHMPRWASRLTLEITDVRVERLQDISHEDALAEGVDDRDRMPYGLPVLSFAVANYHKLWDKINGPGAWDANPWVWVVEFRRAS